MDLGTQFGRTLRRLGLLAMLLVLGVACGSGNGNGNGDDAGAPPADSDGEITVRATEFEFEPSNISVSDGSFTIILRNTGTAEHDFVIEGEDDVEDMDHLIHAMPDETDQGDYDLDDGTYTFYCSIPGHRQSGMEGTLTVG